MDRPETNKDVIYVHLKLNGLHYRHSNKRGWYYSGIYIAANSTEALEWCNKQTEFEEAQG